MSTQGRAPDINTIAGNGIPGFAGDHGPATAAELSEPTGVAADVTGNLLIADSANQRLRVVAAKTGTFYGQAMTAGDIYTVAGNGKRGFAGDHGPGASAELNRPTGVSVDAAGNLLIADLGNNRVRVVAARTGTLYGQATTAGDIYTVAGGQQAGGQRQRRPSHPSPSRHARGSDGGRRRQPADCRYRRQASADGDGLTRTRPAGPRSPMGPGSRSAKLPGPHQTGACAGG